MSLQNFYGYDGQSCNPSFLYGLFQRRLGNFIIPEYLRDNTEIETSELNVVETATLGKVKVKPGAANVPFLIGDPQACLYINDTDVELTLTSSAANPRIDRIVVRAAATNARLTVVQGVAAATPTMPAITDDDVPLAWVYLPAGYDSAADIIPAEHIHDERIFKHIGSEAYNNPTKNLMYNSEFIAYSLPAATNVAPEGWRLTAPAPNSITGTTLSPSPAKRGRRITLTADAGEGMTTSIRIPPGIHTIRGSIAIGAGAGTVQISISGTSATVTKYFYPITVGGSSTHEFLIRREEIGEEITILVCSNSAGAVFFVGQIMVVQGYITGAFRPKHEIIFLDTALTDAAWTATAKSTDEATIDLDASFGPILSVYSVCRGVILRVFANDSGSAAGLASVYIVGELGSTDILSELRLDGIPNDAIRETVMFVPLNETNAFRVGTIATGAGTLDVTIEVIGIIT